MTRVTELLRKENGVIGRQGKVCVREMQMAGPALQGAEISGKATCSAPLKFRFSEYGFRCLNQGTSSPLENAAVHFKLKQEKLFICLF